MNENVVRFCFLCWGGGAGCRKDINRKQVPATGLYCHDFRFEAAAGAGVVRGVFPALCNRSLFSLSMPSCRFRSSLIFSSFCFRLFKRFAVSILCCCNRQTNIMFVTCAFQKNQKQLMNTISNARKFKR